MLDGLMYGFEQGAESIELTEQQELRVQQVEVLAVLLEAVISDIEGDEGGCVTKRFTGLTRSDQEMANRVGALRELTEEILPQAAAQIALNPDLTLQDILPEMLSKLKHSTREAGETGFTMRLIGMAFRGVDPGEGGLTIDIQDVDSQRELLVQKAQVMRFLQSIKQYEAVKVIGEDVMAKEIKYAKTKVSSTYKLEIQTKVYNKYQRFREKHEEDWLAEGMTTEQIDEFIKKMREDEIDRRETEAALESYVFTPSKDIPSHKKEVWDVYNEVFDPQDQDYNMAEANYDFVVKEIMVNAPLIVLGGKYGQAAYKGVSTATRFFVQNSTRLQAYLARGTRGARVAKYGIEGGRIAVSLAAEGTVFSGVHTGLAKAIGIQDEWLLDKELPDAIVEVLWTCVALGLFKVAGKRADWVGKQADMAIARQYMKNLGYNPTGAKYAVEAIAKNIRSGTTKKLIHEFIFKGNIEAAVMLTLGAVQSGLYNGSLEEFFEHFDEQIFHAYVAVGALKTSGHGTGKAMKPGRSARRQSPQEGVRVSAEDAKASRRRTAPKPSSEKVVRENASLKDKARLEKAEDYVVDKQLLDSEGQPTKHGEALLKAHEMFKDSDVITPEQVLEIMPELTRPQAESIVSDHEASLAQRTGNEYTPEQIALKKRLLLNEGFSKSEARSLIEYGLAGEETRLRLPGTVMHPALGFEVGRQVGPNGELGPVIGANVNSPYGRGRFAGIDGNGRYLVGGTEVEGTQAFTRDQFLTANPNEASIHRVAGRRYGAGEHIDCGPEMGGGQITIIRADGKYSVRLRNGREAVLPERFLDKHNTPWESSTSRRVAVEADSHLRTVREGIVVSESTGVPIRYVQGCQFGVGEKVNLGPGINGEVIGVSTKDGVSYTVKTNTGEFRYSEQALINSGNNKPLAPELRARQEQLIAIEQVREAVARPHESDMPIPEVQTSEGFAVGTHEKLGLVETGYCWQEAGLNLFLGSTRGGKKGANEDGGAWNARWKAMAAADGMGGHAAGDVATQTFTRRFAETAPAQGEGFRDFATRVARDSYAEMQRMVEIDGSKRGMGFAFVAARVATTTDGKKYVEFAWAGDAPGYIIGRDGMARDLTRPDSKVQDLVDLEYIEPHAARNHPERNVIKNPVIAEGPGKRPEGTYPFEVHYSRAWLRPGDRVILTSDGIGDNVSPQESADVTAGRNIRDAARTLDQVTSARMQRADSLPDVAEQHVYEDGFAQEPKSDHIVLGIMEVPG